MVIGQDNKKGLSVVIGTFLYGGNSFLGAYDPLDGAILCVGQISNDKECSSNKGIHEHLIDMSFTMLILSTYCHLHGDGKLKY